MRCPECGAREVNSDSARTVYGCGSSDLQRRLTFAQSELCKGKSEEKENVIRFLTGKAIVFRSLGGDLKRTAKLFEETTNEIQAGAHSDS